LEYGRKAFTSEEWQTFFETILYKLHHPRASVRSITEDIEYGLLYLYDLLDIKRLMEIALDDPNLSISSESSIAQYLADYLEDSDFEDLSPLLADYFENHE